MIGQSLARITDKDIDGLELDQLYMISDLWESTRAAVELGQLTPEQVVEVLTRLSNIWKKEANHE